MSARGGAATAIIVPRAALALVLVLVLGCAAEDAATVDVRVREAGDSLCLVAFGDGDVVFRRSYGGDQGTPDRGTLTFVAGSRVSESVRITARLTRGGRIVGGQSDETGFADAPGVVLPLEVRRCHPRPARLATATVQTLASVPDAATNATLIVIDADGDGRDELALATDDGRLVAIDGETATGSVRDLGATVPAGAGIAAVTDADSDCLLDLAFATSGGVIVVRSPGRNGEQLLPLGPSAIDVCAGDVRGIGQPAIAIAGPEGVQIIQQGTGGGDQVLDSGAYTSVALADLTADGIDDIVAAGPMGTRVWVGGSTGATEAAGALPASFASVTGPIAVGDVDGDGPIDVVAVDGMTLRVAINRGDGLLEDRTGATPPASATGIVRVIVADVDGDCRDDVAWVDASGAVSVLRSEMPVALRPIDLPFGPARDVAAADLDGDGARELVVLVTDGDVEVWRP